MNCRNQVLLLSLNKFRIIQPSLESISLKTGGGMYSQAANREGSDDNYLYCPHPNMSQGKRSLSVSVTTVLKVNR
ncbi:hypothetical protein Hanom_Chr06g00574801 [Helianthus anomalus]